MRTILRVLVALTFAAIAFVIGACLPLYTYWFFHGDPGMPGGAALGLMGIGLGIGGSLIVGVVAFECSNHPDGA